MRAQRRPRGLGVDRELGRTYQFSVRRERGPESRRWRPNCQPVPIPLSHTTTRTKPTPMHAAVVSTKKSISLACRPGTHSCAISIAPLKLASPIATAQGRSGYPAPNAMPTDRKIARCSRLCGAAVTSRCCGGTKDSTVIAEANSHPDIRKIRRIGGVQFVDSDEHLPSNVTRRAD
jgi:hypothetical protein